MKNYVFVESKKIKSAKFHWDLGFSLKNGTKPEKIKKTHFLPQACHNYLFLEQLQATDLEKFYNIFEY